MSLFLLFNPVYQAAAFGVAGNGQAGSVSIPGSISVSLYSDNAGVPGAFIAFLGAFPDTAISGDSLLRISAPVQLAAGRYWIQLSGNQLSGIRWVQAGDDSGSGVATELWYKNSAGTITSGANVTGPSYQMDIYGDAGTGSVSATGTAAQIGIARFVSGVAASGSATALGGGTFSRSSSATYIDPIGLVQTVGNDVLRYQNGLPLLEGSATNAAFPSVPSSGWTLTNITTSSGNLAPDGSTNGIAIVEALTGTNAYRITQTFSTINATSSSTLSAFVKPGSRSWCRLIIQDTADTNSHADAWFNLSAGTIGTVSVQGTGTGATATMTACANGYYRCTLSCTRAGSTSGNINAYVQGLAADNVFSNSGTNGTTSIYVWGCQLEAGTAATSYIATTSGTATRAADTISTAGIEAIVANATGIAGIGLADGQPSLDLSFMAQTLDPRITFSRTFSTATYFDNTGTLQGAAANAPRFDYDPVALTYRGLLIETGRTNSIRNNTMVGASAGSPGALPTNWATSLNGLTRTISTGTESGIPYIDVRYNGTTTDVWFDLQFETSTGIAASNGQTWSMSAYLKLAAGSLANIDSQILVQQYYNSTPSFIGAQTQSFTPTSASLASQRNQFVATIAASNTAFIFPYIKFNCQIGVAIDITIRVGAPQLENGTGVTSLILTSGSVQSRGSDITSMPAGDWYNASTGTMVVEAISEVASSNEFLATLNDTTNQNEIRIYVSSNFLDSGILSSNTLYYNYHSGSPNVQYGVVNRAALAWTSSTASTAWNGTVFNTGSVTGPLPNITNLQIGARTPGVFVANAWLREIRYWPQVLSNSDLVDATSGLAVGEPFDSVSATITGVSGSGRVRADNETLEYDFMRCSIDPSLTFTRSSTAYYFDQTGTLQAASNAVPRFEYDPVTLLLRGLLIEESRTNSIRNPRAEGAAAGTPGTLPTNWGVAIIPSGVTRSVIGTGTENGIPYVDVRINGTPSSNAFFSLAFEANTQIAASQNQTWSGSVYVKVVGGSLTNIAAGGLTIIERDSGGTNIGGGGTTYTPNAQALGQVRWTTTVTLPDATAAFVSLRVDLGNFTTGQAVDVTYRVGAPQIELGQIVTSVILPPVGSPAATTRASDSLVNTSIGGWYNPSASTMAVEAMFTWANAISTGFPGLAQFQDVSGNNRIELYVQPSTTSVRFGDNYTSNINDIIITAGNATPGAVFKVAASISSSTASAVLNGGTVQTAIPANFPGALLTRLIIGNLSGSTTIFNGYIQRFRYWNSVISDTALQIATTSESAVPQVNATISGVAGTGQAQTMVMVGLTGAGATGASGTLSSWVVPVTAFTRSSTATYVDVNGYVVTAPNNYLRPLYSGSSLIGALLEGSATNLASPSTNFASWAVHAGTNTANSGTAPDNTNTAAKLAEDNTNSNHYGAKNFTVVGATQYTLSFYAKAVEDRFIQLFFDDGTNGISCNFDLVGGTVGTVGTHGTGVAGSATITAAANGFYRCSISGITNGNTTGRTGVLLVTSLAAGYAQTYIGTTGNGVLVWGAQLELGTAPTSFIYTTGSSATRAADSWGGLTGVAGTGSANSLTGGTFSRASSATYVDPAGVLQTVGSNILRYQSGVPLIEASSTNQCSNPLAEGAVVGTPGTMPTGWSAGSQNGGITPNVVGSGTLNGVPYVDVQFSGTTNGFFCSISLPTNYFTVAQNQSWAVSAYLMLVSGSLSGITSNFIINEYTSGHSFLTNHTVPITTPTATWQRISGNVVIQNASAGTGNAVLYFGTSNGVPINFTIRVGVPQAELGSLTSVILPPAGSPAVTTRAADTISPTGLEAIALSVTGVSVTGAVGTFTPSTSDAITGVAGTGATTALGGGTFSRSSSATYVDPAGLLQTVGNDVLRYQGGVPLTEASSTNQIRNPRCEGAVVGTVGSGGAVPTNWLVGTLSGLTLQVIGSGYQNGFPYVDLRWTGTSTTGFQAIVPDLAIISAAQNQAWSVSCYVALVGGSLTNVLGFLVYMQEEPSVQNLLGSYPTPNSTLTQFFTSATTRQANTTSLKPILQLQCLTSGPVDVTIRLAAPQFELSPTVTSIILPPIGSPAVTTRAADTITPTGIEAIASTPTGVAGTGARGTFTDQVSVTITGAAATGAAGTVTTQSGTGAVSVPIIGVSANSGPYIPHAVRFDGSETLQTSSLTASDSPVGFASMWMYAEGNNFNNDVPGFIGVGPNAYNPGDAGGDFQFLTVTGSPFNWVFNSFNGVNGDLQFTWNALFSTGSWQHILLAWDVLNQKCALYLNDTLITPSTSGTSGTPPSTVLLSGQPFSVIASIIGTGSNNFPNNTVGRFADYQIYTGQSILQSDSTITVSDRRHFIDGAKDPVNPTVATAAYGSPMCLFSGNAANFATNQGTGGAFTLTGTLTDTAGPVATATTLIAPSITSANGSGSVGSVVPSDRIQTSGVTGTGSAGSETAAVSANATGVSGTSAAGSIVDSISKTITGVAASGQSGTTSDQVSVPPLGASATAASGTLSDQISITASGVAGTGVAGSATTRTDDTGTVTGVTGNGQSGSLTSSIAITLPSVAASGACGSATTTVSDTGSATGTAASGSAGTLRVSEDTTLAGVEASGQAGTPVARIATTLTGVAASGAAGTIRVSIAEDLSGVLGHGFAGTAIIADSFRIDGASANGSSGSLVVSESVAISGTHATGSAGSFALTESDTLSGVVGSASAGTATAKVAVFVSGTSSTASAGAVGETTAGIISGPSVTGLVGTLSDLLAIQLTGASATSAADQAIADVVATPLGCFGTGEAGVAARLLAFGVEGVTHVGDATAELDVFLTGNFGTGEVGDVIAEILNVSLPALYYNLENPDFLRADPLANTTIAASFSTTEPFTLKTVKLLLKKEPA